MLQNVLKNATDIKVKSVPLHVMEALGGEEV
jgi:hypothetical protein